MNRNENNFLETDLSKRKKKKNNFKRILIFGILIIIIPYFCYKIMGLLKNPSNTYLVSNGELKEEESAIGYIVREETIVESDHSGDDLRKIKQEGERVAKGDTIFRYSSEQEAELRNQITEIDEEIQKIMEDEDNIFSSDKKMLESQIADEMDKAYQVNELRKIKEYKSNINTYLSKKARIIGENTPSNSNLKQLIDQRTEYEEELNNVSEDVKAPEAGMISYRVDDFENVLTPNNFDELNKEFLESLNLVTGQNTQSNSDRGKVVNNFNCYIIFNSNSEQSKDVKLNSTIKIKFQNEEEKNAVVSNIIEEEDGSRTIAIKLKNNTEKLLEYRKISFDILWWTINGFRIPNSTIIEENNIKYVIRNRNGYLDRMPVKILKQGEEYSIVSGYTKKELKDLGLSDSEISDLKTITLYDRIQLKPSK